MVAWFWRFQGRPKLSVSTASLGEALSSEVRGLPFLAETGLGHDELIDVFDLTDEVATWIAQLVVSHGLVGAGRAQAFVSFGMGRPSRLPISNRASGESKGIGTGRSGPTSPRQSKVGHPCRSQGLRTRLTKRFD